MSLFEDLRKLPTGNSRWHVAMSLHVLASIAQAGRIVGWGEDYYDVILNNIPPGDDFVAVDAGGNRAAAIRADGSLVSWGINTWGGQVGTLPPAGNDFVQIATGTLFNVALREDGSLVAWGLNRNNVLTTVPQGNHFSAIAAGGSQAVALTDDGTIVVWGDNYWGQHAASGATDIQAIAATGLATIAIKKSTGSLLVWDQFPEHDPADDMRWVPIGHGGALCRRSRVGSTNRRHDRRLGSQRLGSSRPGRWRRLRIILRRWRLQPRLAQRRIALRLGPQ